MKKLQRHGGLVLGLICAVLVGFLGWTSGAGSAVPTLGEPTAAVALYERQLQEKLDGYTGQDAAPEIAQGQAVREEDRAEQLQCGGEILGIAVLIELAGKARTADDARRKEGSVLARRWLIQSFETIQLLPQQIQNLDQIQQILRIQLECSTMDPRLNAGNRSFRRR